LQKYPEALSAYNRAIRYKKDHSESWYSKGNVLVNLGKDKEALTAYETAIKYNPDYREAIKARKKLQERLEEQLEDKDKEQKTGFFNFFRR
jgi:tetratricopeptide (TPR) repeat protein